MLPLRPFIRVGSTLEGYLKTETSGQIPAQFPSETEINLTITLTYELLRGARVMAALNDRTLEEWAADCIQYRSPEVNDSSSNVWECLCLLPVDDLNDLVGLARLQKLDLETACFRYLATKFNADLGIHEVQKVDIVEEVV